MMSAAARRRFEEAVHARLSAGSAAHSMRVAAMAETLAGVYGVDTDEAWVAGALHDWCRDTGGAQLLREAGSLGIPVCDEDRAVPYLLHAPVGAALLRDEFPGLTDAVLMAVEVHTYGAREMDALAKIVYVADTIEPARSHDGAEGLRRVVGEVSLDELFARTYAASLSHLVASRKAIHPMTVATWNALVAGGPR